MSVQMLIWIVLGFFVLYRIYLRLRRTFGWQELRLRRVQTMTIILSLVGLIFFAEGAMHPVSLISDVAGIVLGTALAWYSSTVTAFEHRNGKVLYRSSAWIAGIVTLLFFGRLIYRIIDMIQSGYFQQGAQMSDRLAVMGSSWSAGLMLIMFAYYVTYNVILLNKQKGLQRS